MHISDKYLEWCHKLILVLSPFREKVDPIISLISMPLLSFNTIISSGTFKNEQQALYVSLKIFSFVFALLYRRIIPSQWHSIKHFLNFCVGVFIVLCAYGSQIFYLLFIALLGFSLMKIIPYRINRLVSFVLFFGICFCYNCYIQLEYWGENRYGFNNAIMQITLKIVSVVFCLHDGTKKDSELWNNHHKTCKIKKEPTFLQYFGYLFFHGMVLNPPVFEFKHYMESIENEKRVRGPIDWKAILKRLIWIPIYVMIIINLNKYGVHEDLAKKKYSKGKSLMNLMINTIAVNFLISSKLIFAGCIAEMIGIVSCIGYTERKKIDENGNETNEIIRDWEDIKCVDPYGFELSPSIRTKIMSWNIGVEKWMRFYVYFRLPRVSKFLNKLITGFVASFWHGMYVGIFMSYGYLQVINQIYQIMWKKLDFQNRKKNHWSNSIVNKVFSSIAGWVVIRLSSSFFFLQTWEEIKHFHGERFKWSWIYTLFIAVFIALVFPKMRRKKHD